MRITNVISGLEGGGAEHVATVLSNLWIEEGKQVQVVVRSAIGPAMEKTNLDPAIPVSLVVSSEIAGKWPPRMKNLGVLLAIRDAIKKSRPDVVIAYMDTVAVDTLLATLGTGIPVIVAEHCDPNARPIGAMTIPAAQDVAALDARVHVREKLRQWLYPRAAAVVCLTDTAMSFFPPKVRNKGRVIPNPVLPPPARPLCADGKKDPCRVVYVGRLSAVKGLDRLLRAYAKVAPRHRQWHLELWGDGPESGPLKELAEQLSMTDRVRFGGWTDSPYSVLRDADLFVMSSHTEGFPMGLCEAMACGVPPVSFDCPSGPRHIIRHGIDGVLVQNGDVDSLAEAMGQLMGDEEARNRLASRAPEVLERFSARKVLAMWEDLFRQVTGRESHAGRKACV